MKRIIALIGAIALLALYVIAFILAFSNHPNAENWLMAAIFSTVVIPAILYAWTLTVNFRKKPSSDEEDSDT